ncbi:50S ribosomal protein L27 [Gammaproteobacteria bacterium]|nr:50S ribosomal protein L27 [Gammaproteobacteria bacterium]
MAHKKAGGSTRNGRDSNPQYRGVKIFGGQSVSPGNIIVRQVGNTYHGGKNVVTGKDYTLMSSAEGIVTFVKRGRLNRHYVDVLPIE